MNGIIIIFYHFSILSKNMYSNGSQNFLISFNDDIFCRKLVFTSILLIFYNFNEKLSLMHQHIIFCLQKMHNIAIFPIIF